MNNTISECYNLPPACSFGGHKRLVYDIKKNSFHDLEWSPVLPFTWVGIEVEVEGISKKVMSLMESNLQEWTPHEDNSLRATETTMGREYVTPPILAGDAAGYLYLLKQTLEINNPKLNFSGRTSIHVHMDVKDLTAEQLAALMLAYISTEPLLYGYVAQKFPDREEGIFCVPINDILSVNSSFGDGVKSFFQSPTKRSLSNLIDVWDSKKYTGLNPRPLNIQGTLEFRSMGGTLDLPYLLKWINLILSLKKYAYTRTNYTQTKQEIADLNTNSKYYMHIMNIYGSFSESLMSKVTQYGLGKELEDSVAATKVLCSKARKFYTYPVKYEKFESSSLKKLLEHYGVTFHKVDTSKKAEYMKMINNLTKKKEEITLMLRMTAEKNPDAYQSIFKTVVRELYEVGEQLQKYRQLIQESTL